MRSMLILCGALCLCACHKGQPTAPQQQTKQQANKPAFEAQLRGLNEAGDRKSVV